MLYNFIGQVASTGQIRRLGYQPKIEKPKKNIAAFADSEDEKEASGTEDDHHNEGGNDDEFDCEQSASKNYNKFLKYLQ